MFPTLLLIFLATSPSSSTVAESFQKSGLPYNVKKNGQRQWDMVHDVGRPYFNQHDLILQRFARGDKNEYEMRLNSADSVEASLGWQGEHWASLDPESDKISLAWTINHANGVATFQLEFEGRGWVMLALTYRGQLNRADVIYAWIDNSANAHIVDAHGNMFGEINRDASQDYRLIVGYREKRGAHRTIIRFQRDINTCDPDNDFIIGNDTMHLVWEYHQTQILSPNHLKSSEDFRQLKGERRGKRVILFHDSGIVNSYHEKSREGNKWKYQTGPRSIKWLVTTNDVLVPAKSTVYWCTMVELPRIPSDVQYQMVGYRPIFSSPDSARHVHHMMLYECHHESPDAHRNSQSTSNGYDCHGLTMPKEFKRSCKGIIAAWGLGGEPFEFPENVGYPVGSGGRGDRDAAGTNFYMLEIHYENPGLRSDLVDSSGLEIALRETSSSTESALLTVGHDVSPFQLIPPRQTSYTIVAHCPQFCTKIFPSEGVQVFAGFPHTHDLGTSVRLRHIRNGKELPMPFQDRSFEPNYQTMRRFSFRLMPGDHLISECTYNSSSRTRFTRGGFVASSEMCVYFLHYYPATPLAHCTSRLSLRHVLNAMSVTPYDIDSNTRRLGLRIREPVQYQNLTFAHYLHVLGGEESALAASLDAFASRDGVEGTVDSSIYDDIYYDDENFVSRQNMYARLQEAAFSHSHKAECFDFGMKNKYADGLEFAVPKIKTPYYKSSSFISLSNRDKNESQSSITASANCGTMNGAEDSLPYDIIFGYRDPRFHKSPTQRRRLSGGGVVPNTHSHWSQIIISTLILSYFVVSHNNITL